MFCAISGKPPRVAAISPSSKCVFEKSLLEQYVKEHGIDPVSNEPITVDQIITVAQSPLQHSLNDNLNSATLNSNYSIPSLLSTLQNEWDALMLENFSLRKQLDQITKEFSTALFERDAAKLVAARLLQEKNVALNDIKTVVSTYAEASRSNNNLMEDSSIKDSHSDMSKSMVSDSQDFVKETKKHIPKELVLPEGDNVFEANSTSEKLASGMICFPRITYIEDKKRIPRIFQDPLSLSIIYDSFSNQKKFDIPETWTVGNEALLSMLCLTNDENIVVALTRDNKLVVYDLEKQETLNSIYFEVKDVIYICCHERVMKDCILIVKRDGTVAYVNYKKYTADENSIITVISGEPSVSYQYAQLHKDGLLLALGDKVSVSLINLSNPLDQPIVFQCNREIPSDGGLTKVFFPRNGYWMMVQSEAEIFTFDLRKDDHSVLATPPIKLSQNKLTRWDLDLSGKTLVISESEGTIQIIHVYVYTKTKKQWIHHSTHQVKQSSVWKPEEFIVLRQSSESNNAALFETSGGASQILNIHV
ncbi:E3 ubiquitin-protein ligase PRP19 [Maudiozyma barnettii]|uniref:Pre-mRNA-processing factor 19 n=1 Tax=Maudiozyma barnettii TaxID=61262 RepID=A0A8H2ZI70_9SACH|nr:E3 ubiquitin-protein ligase PRP19 [Kazachstania barnettii]CAB4255578.1 similar to Saccharomyces cerevisiae YLL036C PRP19 Splicing factor associated with the spliceosome [Kazachstania barnettii]